MKEILTHKYEVRTKQELKKFEESLSSQDYKGNNAYHDTFLLDMKDRNEFLAILLGDEYEVKCYVDPHQKEGCCG